MFFSFTYHLKGEASSQLESSLQKKCPELKYKNSLPLVNIPQLNRQKNVQRLLKI